MEVVRPAGVTPGPAFGAIRGDLITDMFQGQGLAELTPKEARITAIGFEHVDAR
ncbi:hypothetical protein [Streptomyces sp. NPDC006355]|uniref:hypothetical protein n=1 Tax=Streptomyces sp. NPDC006355 TaxID=3156758 RepID=UPI0033A275D5